MFSDLFSPSPDSSGPERRLEIRHDARLTLELTVEEQRRFPKRSRVQRCPAEVIDLTFGGAMIRTERQVAHLPVGTAIILTIPHRLAMTTAVVRYLFPLPRTARWSFHGVAFTSPNRWLLEAVAKQIGGDRQHLYGSWLTAR